MDFALLSSSSSDKMDDILKLDRNTGEFLEDLLY